MPDPRPPNSVQEAFARAAGRGGPLFQPYEAFLQTMTTWPNGSTRAGFYDLLFAAPGALRWKDVDRTDAGGADVYMGEGVLTLYSDFPGPTPDFLREPDGNWLLVTSAAERDALRATLRLSVRRWVGNEPELVLPTP